MRFRAPLAGLLAVLSCTALAQQPAARRIEGALRSIQQEYVDELDEGQLVERCVGGIEAWLSGRGMRLGPTDAPPMQPISRVGELLRRVELRYSGIGLELAIERGTTKIVTTLEGTPTSHSDLRRDAPKRMFQADSLASSSICPTTRAACCIPVLPSLPPSCPRPRRWSRCAAARSPTIACCTRVPRTATGRRAMPRWRAARSAFANGQARKRPRDPQVPRPHSPQ